MARLSHDPATGITRFFAYPKPGAIVLKASTLAGANKMAREYSSKKMRAEIGPLK